MSSNANRSRQLNPCDHIFWKSRGYPARPQNWKDELIAIGYNKDDEYNTDDDDGSEYEATNVIDAKTLKSRHNNPCDQYFWTHRGYSARPEDWEDELYRIGYYDDDEEEEYEEDEVEDAIAQANVLKSRVNNPCDHYFWNCRGYSERPDNWRDELYNIGYYDEEDSEENDYSEEEYYDGGSSDNNSATNALRSRQLNPCDDLFWKCRGYSGRPSDWKNELHRIGYYNN